MRGAVVRKRVGVMGGKEEEINMKVYRAVSSWFCKYSV
jgi:hypothetical protein